MIRAHVLFLFHFHFSEKEKTFWGKRFILESRFQSNFFFRFWSVCLSSNCLFNESTLWGGCMWYPISLFSRPSPPKNYGFMTWQRMEEIRKEKIQMKKRIWIVFLSILLLLPSHSSPFSLDHGYFPSRQVPLLSVLVKIQTMSIAATPFLPTPPPLSPPLLFLGLNALIALVFGHDQTIIYNSGWWVLGSFREEERERGK